MKNLKENKLLFYHSFFILINLFIIKQKIILINQIIEMTCNYIILNI
jgi:hypothetical protein